MSTWFIRVGIFLVCYALNHFLALLVNELAGGKHFTAKRRLRAVDSADAKKHACDTQPARCWEHRHTAQFSGSRCGSEATHIDKPEKYDIAILRHGPRADTPKLARQILPYRSVWRKT